jgi:hypothetical protein
VWFVQTRRAPGLARVALAALLLAACAAPSSDAGGGGAAAGDPSTGDHAGLPADPVPPDEPAPPDGTDPDAGLAADASGPTTHDAAANPPPDACALAVVPKAPYVKYGLHPDASDALASLGFTADRISQTIGNAPASAGTHAQDGTAQGKPYSAATDLRIVGLSETQIRALLGKLAHVGFAAWYRKPGYDGWPSYDAPHIHAVWVGAPMKQILRSQVHDFAVGKNGLANHAVYQFYAWPKCVRDELVKRFDMHNPASN